MLFGSDKLPGLAKGIGRGLREINDAKNQIQNEIIENRVTGNTVRPPYYEKCSLTRMDYLSKDRNETCGKAGKWWTPQNKKDLFKFIKHVSV